MPGFHCLVQEKLKFYYSFIEHETMNVEQLIEKRKQEIKELSKFRSYMQVLKENVGVTDETMNEMQLKISCRISQCEINIRAYQQET